jgi:hypothetical protein
VAATPPAPDRQEPVLADDERLWRRIRPDWQKSVPGRDDPVPTSNAFRDELSYKVSVYRAHLYTEDELLADHPTWGIVEVIAGDIKALGYPVKQDDPEGNPAHAYFDNPTTGIARKIAAKAKWVRHC